LTVGRARFILDEGFRIIRGFAESKKYSLTGCVGHAMSAPRIMLEQLFGSKTRVRLLRLFLQNGKSAFFVRELSRKLGSQINAIRNELENLVDMGIVEAVADYEGEGGSETGSDGKGKDKVRRSVQQRKYYRLNQESLLYPELRALFMKSRLMLEKDFVRRIGSAGPISYLALTGFFVSDEPSSTDLLVVGKVNREKLAGVIKNFQREVGREVNYTVLTPQEFRYRRDVTDRFLYSILESQKIVVIDTITMNERAGATA
jgi:DNA-binding transcriptional ArsR family regulator